MKAPDALLPFVPGGPDFEASRRLFKLLGFRETWDNEGYVGYEFGNAKFILQDFNDAHFAGNLMIKLEVADPDAWWADYQEIAEQVANTFPKFRIKPPHDYAWGREVHFIDLAGVCWHVGRP